MGASNLQFVPAAIRRSAYFDGLLKALQVLNIDYDMADLSKITADKIDQYKQVWAFSTDEMNAKDQQVIVDYAKTGGNVVIFPNLPDREMSQKSCTIIRDALSVHPIGNEIIDSPLVDIYDLKDIKCANPQIIYSEKSLSGAEIIARTIKGTPCGFSKSLGKGTVIHLGTWIGFDTEGHKPVYEAILQKSSANLRQTTSSNDYLIVKQRFTDTNSAMLFVGNYYNEEQAGKVIYTHPQNGEAITIPFVKDEMLWPPLYAMLTPICFELNDGIKILHCTSDILGFEKLTDQIKITLQGDRDLAGEIVFEGSNVSKIKSASIDGESLNILAINDCIVLNYSHKHNKEILLTVKLS